MGRSKHQARRKTRRSAARGHSLGGLLVRLYASAYSDEVVGMVQLDPFHEDMLSSYQAVLTVTDTIGGKTATALWEGERHFDVVVRLTAASRETLGDIPDVRVPTPDVSVVDFRRKW